MRRRRHSLPAQLLRRVRPSEAVRVVKVSRQALGVGAVVWPPLGPAPLDRLLPVDDTQTFLLSVCSLNRFAQTSFVYLCQRRIVTSADNRRHKSLLVDLIVSAEPPLSLSLDGARVASGAGSRPSRLWKDVPLARADSTMLSKWRLKASSVAR